MSGRPRAILRRLDSTLLQKPLHIYERMLFDELTNGYSTLLDVGCGLGSLYSDGIAKLIAHSVGVDGNQSTVEECRLVGPYDEYHCLDALDVGNRFGPNSFDVVVALDVIEHFPKRDGWRLLDALESVALRRVIVFTPNGFLRQGEKDGNPLQIHRSGWSTGEFEGRGYRVAGINGWKPLRGELWEPRIKPPALGHRLSAATQALVTHRPQRAFQLLAVRDLD